MQEKTVQRAAMRLSRPWDYYRKAIEERIKYLESENYHSECEILYDILGIMKNFGNNDTENLDAILGYMQTLGNI